MSSSGEIIMVRGGGEMRDLRRGWVKHLMEKVVGDGTGSSR